MSAVAETKELTTEERARAFVEEFRALARGVRDEDALLALLVGDAIRKAEERGGAREREACAMIAAAPFTPPARAGNHDWPAIVGLKIAVAIRARGSAGRR